MAAVARRPLLVCLRALGLGDLLTALPALRGLSAAFPRHRRVLAAPAPLAELALLAGAADEVAGCAALEPLPARLHGADVAVNLHGRGPQSHRLLLAARPRRLLAFGSDGVPGPPWRAGEHEPARWCRMLAWHGVACDPARLDLSPPALPAPPAARRATLIHPGAAAPARRWPPERFAAVASAEARAGRPVAITGGRDEVELARAVARRAGLPRSSVLAGRTGLAELAAAVAAADRVVCGDTGVAHLATALGTPSVVVFGPTSPAEWGPPPGRAEHRALWAGIGGDPHGAQPGPGLLAIGVDAVLAALAASRSGQFPRAAGG